MDDDNKKYDEKDDNGKFGDIREYVSSINNYVSTIRENPIVSTPTIIPKYSRDIMSLDERIDEEIRTISRIEDTYHAVEKSLRLANASPSQKPWLKLKYAITGRFPQFREDDVSLSELLLLESGSISKSCHNLIGLNQSYGAIASNLEDFEERIYEQTERLAERNDNLNERIGQTKEVLEQHIMSKKKNPTERERNEYFMLKNKLTRSLTDLTQELQLNNQQYVLAVDQALTIDQTINLMKAQSGVVSTIALIAQATADYIKETAPLHDTAERMHVLTGEVMDKTIRAGRIVEKLGEMRHIRQTMTIEKAKDYMGDTTDGSAYRKMLEAPTREAQELSKMINKANNEKLKKRYEEE